MATTKAFLRTVNGKGLAPINVKYTHQEQSTPVPTSLNIEPDYFDKASGLVLDTYPQSEQYNAIINQVKNHLMGIANTMVANSIEPNGKLVVAQYREVYGSLNKPSKGTNQNKKTPTRSIETNTIGTVDNLQKIDLASILPKVESTVLPEIRNQQVKIHYINFKFNAQKWVEYSQQNAAGTVRQRKSWLNTILKFSIETNTPLDFANFDENFYLAYGNYLMFGTHNGIKINDNNIYNSTFGAHVKRLKGFLTHAKKYLNQNPNPKFEDYRVLEDEKDVIYLSAREIDLLWEFRLQKDTRVVLEGKKHRIMLNAKPVNVKMYIEYAIFGCLTGLRWSDITRSAWIMQDLRENNDLYGKCQKNEGWYCVPLESDDRIGEILKEHNYKLNKIKENDFNAAIKLILQAFYQYHINDLPEYQEQIPYYKYKFKQEFKFHDYKWNLYTSHCNRRTAITNWYYNPEIDLGEREILSMLGSRSSVELDRYIAKDNCKTKNQFKKLREQKQLA